MSEFKGLSNSDLESIGFKSLGHFTVGDQVKFYLSRGRYLSAMCVGQGNESVWLCHKDRDGENTDLICVHNRDYDGFITVEKIKTLIEWFCGGSQKALQGGDQNTKNKDQSIENTGREGGDQKAMRGEHE